MTLVEMYNCYSKDIKKAKETYKYSFQKWLVEHKLDGRVRRKSDGKIGWLDLDSYMSLNFYPQTKSGGRSVYSNGYTSLHFIEDNFEPVIEGEEE